MGLFQIGGLLKKLFAGEAGTAFIDVLAGLAILGFIVPAFLSGLTTTSRAAIISDEKATAGSLALSQMEWIKNAGYSVNATGYSPAPVPDGEDYAGYSVIFAAEPLNNPDDGIQKITVTVKRYDKGIFTVEGYKVNR